jgi:hypothetical protein
MHVYDVEHDGPSMTLELPVAVVEKLAEIAHRHLTPMMGLSVGPLVDELRGQLADRGPGPKRFTVVGVWDDDEAIPVGVIWGEHSVVGGDDEHWEGGLWATSVDAADPLAAETAAVDQMAESDDEDDDDQDFRHTGKHEVDAENEDDNAHWDEMIKDDDTDDN